MRVFLYGTLLDPEVLARMSGRRDLAHRALPARLRGFRRVALRGTPYPTLIPGEGEVDGLLLSIPGQALRRLAAYEGPLYRLMPVRVRTARGFSQAHSWVAARRHADPTRPWALPFGISSAARGNVSAPHARDAIQA